MKLLRCLSPGRSGIRVSRHVPRPVEGGVLGTAGTSEAGRSQETGDRGQNTEGSRGGGCVSAR